MESFSIKTKLTFEDFRKLNFFLLYRKGITRFALIFGSMMLLIIFVPYLTSIPFWEEFPTFPFGIAFAMTFIPPYSIFRTARKNYNTNKMISEEICYEFDKETISISGDTFNSTMKWDQIFEITLSKSWLLIWQNSQVANAIPRRDITNEQIETIKDLVKNKNQIIKSFR